MTRINVGVDPSELNDKMLNAEHREIKRIPNCIRKGRYSMTEQPDVFTLGKGHVKFFYDKLLYLRKRYQKIYAECIKRGFNMTDFSASFDDLPIELCNDYTERIEDRQLILDRIKIRLKK